MEYGLIGEKLGHSYSKIIHEMIGLYSYDLREVAKEELDDFIEAREYKGLNVTIPYKQDVIPHLDYIDDGAKSIGAVNTIVNRDGKLSGYNTDYFGLKRLIEYTGCKLAGKKILILGTGGTSHTARCVVRDLGATEIIIVGRSEKPGNITYEEAIQKHSDAYFIVNTTPCGMYPNIGVSPIKLDTFTNLAGIVDAIYNPARTKLMLEAAEKGIRAYGGLRMLVYQAIVAAELFTDSTVDEKLADKIYKSVRSGNENVVLIGMPAVGKTTVGKKLSKELGMPFVDTDDEIVAREGRPISDIFATDGEEYFRKVESEVIRDVSSRKGSIIATGGGAVMRPENVEVLKSFGQMILIERDLESLMPTGDRPLANNPEKIKTLYKERMPVYRSVADIIIDANDGLYSTVDRIKRSINEY